MNIKIIFSLIASSIAVISYIPYIHNIISGKTKPHAFSWLIWSIITYIAAALQITGGGGIVGASVALITGSISVLIAVIAARQKVVRITRSDRISFVISLSAIPLWIITDRPLLSAILICIIDLFAFWPTIRKSYSRPDQETLSTYWLSAIKHIITVAAQQNYTLVAILFPFNLAVVTVFFVGMIVIRRKQLNLYPTANNQL